MILFWGLDDDPPMRAVVSRAAARGLPLCFVDQTRLHEYAASLTIGDRVGGTLSHGDRAYAIERIAAAYIRPHHFALLDQYQPGVLPPAEQAALYAVEGALTTLCDFGALTVLNRPEAMASNSSKPYQLSLIAACGFRVPDTLITTDADALRAFHARHGRLIYKSISSTRSIVGELDPDDEARLRDLTSFPTLFQQRVDGDDYRVHVVGQRVFAARIVSGGADYRYAGDADVTSETLPDEVAARCLEVARVLGLPLTGIDLRRTPDGEWYVFEANPSPGFTYYEQLTGQPIADAIVDLLVA